VKCSRKLLKEFNKSDSQSKTRVQLLSHVELLSKFKLEVDREGKQREVMGGAMLL
jgi:hypothetical protein